MDTNEAIIRLLLDYFTQTDYPGDEEEDDVWPE